MPFQKLVAFSEKVAAEVREKEREERGRKRETERGEETALAWGSGLPKSNYGSCNNFYRKFGYWTLDISRPHSNVQFVHLLLRHFFLEMF